MKRGTLLLALSLVGCGASGSPRTNFDGTVAFGYLSAQMDFGPRIPGTQAHRSTGDWIEQLLRQRADSVEVQAFTHVTLGGDTLALRNFIGRFRPEARDRVVYLAHWDTRPHADQSPNVREQQRPVPGANDGASGVALLLGVADVLHETPPSVGVDLVFVDGEDYGDWNAGKDVLLGSRYYAAHLGERKPLYGVLWDMIGDADLEIYQEANSVARAPEVVERVWRVADDLGYAGVFRDEVRYTLTDDHISLLEAGVHTIDVIDFDYGRNNEYWHTTEDTLDKVSAKSLQIVGDVAVTLVK